jgi:hypothetical protein
MSQIEVSKLVPYVVTGSSTDEVTVSKLVAYFVVVPGESEGGDDDSGRQGHVHAQILRRS